MRAVLRPMSLAPPVLLAAAVALLAAACATEPTTEAEASSVSVENGQQAYGVVEGRIGYRRLPTPDVSATDLVDFATSTQGMPFVPVAGTGEILLVYFGYLSCPDVCPTTLADFGRAIDELPNDLAQRVSFAMVSVDAERDHGPQIVDYVTVFIDRGHGLLAADASGLAAATEAFGVEFEIEEHDSDHTHVDSEDTHQDSAHAAYGVGHSATVFAVDEDGLIIWEFTYPSRPDDLADALVSLFEERY